jgi:hypothetical protein
MHILATRWYETIWNKDQYTNIHDMIHIESWCIYDVLVEDCTEHNHAPREFALANGLSSLVDVV